MNDTRTKDESVPTLAERIGFVIGVDSEHYAHVHYPAADTVRVYPVGPDYQVGDRIESDSVRVEELDGRPLAKWMAFVADSREWIETTHRAPEDY